MNEVTVTQTNAVAMIDPDFDASLFEGVDSKDILIPKILLCQSMTKSVQAEKNKTGEMINSVTGEIINERDGKLEIVPLKMFKSWSIFHIKNGKTKYVRTEPFTAANANLSWEGTEIDEEGKEVQTKNVQGISCYVLLKKDLNDPAALPYVIKFASTSFKTGRALTNHFTKAQMMKKNPYYKSLLLSAVKEANDESTWYEYRLEDGVPFSRETQSEELEILKSWAKTVAGSAVKVDNSEEAPF